MKANRILSLVFLVMVTAPTTIWAIDPSASLVSAPSITDTGGTTYAFMVRYADDGLIEIGSFSDENVRVIGPGGFDAATAFVGMSGDASPVVTYEFVPPGGSWNSVDNGSYALVMQERQVFDLIGNPVAPGPLGTFTVMAPPGEPSPTPTPGIFGNISTRLRVETGDNALIGGFIVSGAQPKKVIVRAIGPSLPLTGVLADPTLELHDSSGGLIASNDNWRSTQEEDIIATTIPPTNDLESAIVATLPANNSAYTAIVRGTNNGTGVGVVEVYDLDQAVDSKLLNISTRGLVQTGDNVLIGGLIVAGLGPVEVLVRAIGPSLPITGKLADPTLELHDANGELIGFNNDWKSDQHVQILGTTIPPTSEFEAAILHTFSPGSYTAIVRGVGSLTGIAVVEAYALH